MPKRLPSESQQTSHRSDNGSVIIHCAKSRSGSYSFTDIEIAVSDFGASSTSILTKSLLSLNCPFDHSAMVKQKAAILYICQQENIRNILARPIENVSESDVTLVYRAIEKFWERKTYADAANSFYASTRFLRTCNLKIKNNKRLSDVQYRCSLPYKKRKIIDMLSRNAEPGIADKELSAPFDVPSPEKPDNTDKKILSHLSGRLENLVLRVKQYLVKCLALKTEILQNKVLGFPENLSPADADLLRKVPFNSYNTFSKYSLEVRFQSLCWVIENERRYEKSGNTGLALKDHPALQLVNISGGYGVAQWMLVDYFLTREMVASIGVILCIHCGCNPAVIFSLQHGQIEINRNGYRLIGIKGKNDQLQDFSIITPSDYAEISESKKLEKYPARFVLHLLLENYESLRRVISYKGTAVLVAPNAHIGGEFKIEGVTIISDISKLCKIWGVARFTLNQLRPQVASLEYLRSNKNIYYVQAILGHSDLSTTQDYLSNSLLAMLNEKNINRFVLMLEQSIYFVTERHEEIDERLGEKFQQSARNLLLPISDFGDEPETCLISQWLKSMGTMKIEIDDSAVYLVSVTLKYYLRHTESIAARDPQRFLQSHVPLILVCAALHKLILASPLKQRLNYYDKQ